MNLAIIHHRQVKENPKELEAKLKTYSPEELLWKGKKMAEEEDYLKSYRAFRELCSRDTPLKELATLYLQIISTEYLKSIRKNDSLNKPESIREAIKFDDLTIKSIIECMVTATNMYQEGNLQKEDFFEIEKIIDRFPFQETIMVNRIEFQRIYGKFKEYALDVFLKDQKEKHS